MKRKNIVGLIAIVAIVVVAMFAGCVEEEEVPTSTQLPTPTVTPTPILTGPNQYISGDVLAKERTEKDCIFILDYNKTTDEYDVTMIHRNGDENGWYFEEDDYVSQMARERIDNLSPMVIAHIDDILTIPIVTSTSIPLPEPKYIPGDIVEEEKPITEIARHIVISYGKTTDEYEINTIFLNRDRTWGHFVNDDTIWHDREWFEGYCPILIAHVDLSTITIGEPKISPTPTPTSKLISPTPTPTPKVIQIKVIYSGSWTGAYGDIGSTKSVEGTGTKTFTLSNPEFVISAVFQKDDDSSRTLTAEILKNGEVVKSESTSAAYGVVSVSYTL